MNTILKKLASLKLTVALLVITIIVCIRGTLMSYEHALREVYSSTWFLAILTLLSLNLLACSLLKSRRGFHLSNVVFLLIHISIIIILCGGLISKGWGFKGRVIIYKNESASAFFDTGKIERIFNRFDVNGDGQWDSEEVSLCEKTLAINMREVSDKCKWSLAEFDYDRDKKLSLGEWEESLTHAPGDVRKLVERKLSFEIRLEDFVTEYHRPAPWLLIAIEGTRIEEYIKVKPGAVYKIHPWASCIVKIEPYPTGTFPREITLSIRQQDEQEKVVLSLMSSRKMSKNASAGVVGYPVWLSITPDEEARFYYGKRYVAQKFNGDIEQKFKYYKTFDNCEYYSISHGNIHVFYLSSTPLKTWKSELSIYEDKKKVKEKTVTVNHPLNHRGIKFYQSGYDDRDKNRLATILRVVKDPGVPIVYLGFFLLSISLFIKFCILPFLGKSVNYPWTKDPGA